MAQNNQAPAAQTKKTPPMCGHVNEHYQGTDQMTCTLAPNHSGNHQASYKRLILNSEKLPTGAQYENATAAWNDDAGIPLAIIEEMMDAEKAKQKKAEPSLTSRLTSAEVERMRKSSVESGEIPADE